MDIHSSHQACPICGSRQHGSDVRPNTIFNNKEFAYNRCFGCGSVYVWPQPTDADFLLMYPPEYQGVSAKASDPPRFKRQVAILQKHLPKGARILDYGCGAGAFIQEATQAGYTVEGMEFNPKQVEILRRDFPQNTIHAVADLPAIPLQKYDAVYISNVLEHVNNPFNLAQSLAQYIKPSGWFVAEGPLEMNRSPVTWAVNRNYAREKGRGKVNQHSPNHLTLTNASSQKQFFNRCGFNTLVFEIWESRWPMPKSLGDAPGLGGKAKWAIGIVALVVKYIYPASGNSFFYVGSLADDKLLAK